ncbi:MAG: flagellar basal body-associated FliL family protein [Clostridiaceae bacterium]|nr:flagellar basal body-associated FliL family protein [Clostridiaceae bacterium]
MDIKKVILYVVLGVLLSGIFFGTIAYFAFFRTPNEISNQVETYEFNIGSFSTNLSHQRSFFKGEIIIETTNRRLLKVLEEKNAELRDQIIKTLIGKNPEDILKPEGQQQLREELTQVISKVVDSHEITNIYFIDYIVQ